MSNKFPSIINYCGIGHKEINDALRKNEIPNKIKEKIKNLDKELEHCSLPSYSNKLVYRLDSLADWYEVEKWYKRNINTIFKVPEYRSTYKREPASYKYNMVIKTCKNSKGVDIENAIRVLEPVKADVENEVLFKRSTNFIIEKFDQKNKIIFLMETKDKESIILTSKLINELPEVQKDLDIKYKNSNKKLSFTDKGLI